MSFPKIHRIKSQIIHNLGGSPSDSEIQAEYDRMKSESEYISSKQDITISYKQDVYNEMLSVFGTTNSDVALANYETYKLKVSNPSLFPNLSQSDIDEVQLKIDAIQAYIVYRDNRYEQYKAELAAI